MHWLRCLLIALVCPGIVGAQAASDSTKAGALPSAVFAYIQAGDTIALEAVRSDTGMVRGAFIVPNQLRINWDQFVSQGAPASLAIGIFPPNAPAELRPVRETDYALRVDSMVITSYEGGRRTTETRPTTAGAAPVLGRSMIHLAFLAYHAAQQRRRTLPLYLISSGKTVVAQVDTFGERVTLVVEGLQIDAVWDDGILTEVRVPSQQLVVRQVALLPQ